MNNLGLQNACEKFFKGIIKIYKRKLVINSCLIIYTGHKKSNLAAYCLPKYVKLC